MAVDADSYATVALVQGLIGDLVPSRTFTTGTSPTLAEVEGFIDNVADELNAILGANSYTNPVVQATDSKAYGLLILANTVGACALILTSMPTGSFTDLEIETLSSTRYQSFVGRYKKVLKMIQERKLDATRSATDSFSVYSGSRTDRDTGETKDALFSRGMSDYPGARSLQE